MAFAGSKYGLSLRNDLSNIFSFIPLGLAKAATMARIGGRAMSIELTKRPKEQSTCRIAWSDSTTSPHGGSEIDQAAPAPYDVRADPTALRQQNEFERYALVAPAGHPIFHGYLLARTIILNLGHSICPEALRQQLSSGASWRSWPDAVLAAAGPVGRRRVTTDMPKTSGR
ncbi:MAG TPA: hypothetical protein VGI28_07395 [Stellaceae bacterium]